MLLTVLGHQTVFICTLVDGILVALRSVWVWWSKIFLHHVVNFAKVSRPIAYFPTRYMVWNIRCSHARAITLVLSKLALHVPVPLVDLALLETQQLLKLHNLSLLPNLILLELIQKDFILLLILSQPRLCFLGSFNPVPNDNFGHLEVMHSNWCRLFAKLTAFWTVLARALQRVYTASAAKRLKHPLFFRARTATLGHLCLGLTGRLLSRAATILFLPRTFKFRCCFLCILGFLGALQSCSVLLEGSFRSFLK